MAALLKLVGRLAGIVGVVLAVVAVVVRLGGSYTLGGFQVGTVFQAAICALALACLGYVASIVEGPRR